jgi:uncharacterized protein Smg (DUF494 family)
MTEEEGFTPQRVVGLVMHLLREIRENRLQLDDFDGLNEDLLGRGYTESEINAAFSWVYSRFDGLEPSDLIFRADTNPGSFRVLHPAEQAVIRPDAFGQMIEMRTLGMIDMEGMERLIERSMSIGGPLGQSEVRIMAHALLFEESGREGQFGRTPLSFSNGSIH